MTKYNYNFIYDKNSECCICQCCKVKVFVNIGIHDFIICKKYEDLNKSNMDFSPTFILVNDKKHKWIKSDLYSIVLDINDSNYEFYKCENCNLSSVTTSTYNGK